MQNLRMAILCRLSLIGMPKQDLYNNDDSPYCIERKRQRRKQARKELRQKLNPGVKKDYYKDPFLIMLGKTDTPKKLKECPL